MGISWKCAKGHITTSRSDLRFDPFGNYACRYCMEEADPNDCTECHRAPGVWRNNTYREFYACDACMEKTFSGLKVSNGDRDAH